MNLLYTITAYPPSVGGAQAHFHELAQRLVRRHSLQVAAHWAETRTDWLLGTTLRDGTPQLLAWAEGERTASPGLPRQTERGYILDGVPVHLLALTRRERLTILPYVLGYYASKSRAISHISDAIMPHLEPLAQEVGLVHNGRVGRESLSYASLKLARRLDVPFVFTPFHHPRWVGWNYQAYLHLYRQADGVIALTQVEREALMGLGVDPDRIFVTGMGPILSPSPDAASFRQRHGFDGPIVLFLGQKYRYKGLAALLDAAPFVWARFPDTRFVCIGPRTRHSRSLLERHVDPRILEMGTVDLQTKSDALAACDLLCLPSAQESFGAVFTEAWMLGKPVIGGEAPACREVIADGVDGYIVSQEPAAIAERIVHLLTHAEVRDRMGAAGKNKALQNYTWERLAERTEAAYRTVLG